MGGNNHPGAHLGAGANNAALNSGKHFQRYLNEPTVMIMDEPFRGLDAMSRSLMQEFFLELFEENQKTNIFVTSEIDEAIFLADNLVILSNKPTTVQTVIKIDLPRPRNYKMLTTAKAFKYKRQAMDLLHGEAMKSFAVLK